MTSHIAHLKDPKGDPFQLDYIDSGSKSEEALTIVACHGMGFNAGVWGPLAQLTPPNTRFIAYNQRGYGRSSPRIEAKEPGGLDVTRRQVEDLSLFLRYAVDELHVSPYSPSKPQSGIILLGWSKGTLLCLGLLNGLLTGSVDVPFTKKYVQRIILFEPPGSILARVTPAWQTGVKQDSPAPAFMKSVTGEHADSEDGKWKPSKEIQELLDNSFEPSNASYFFAWKLARSPRDEKELVTRLLTDRWEEFPRPFIGLIYGAETVSYSHDIAHAVEELWKQSEPERRGASTTVPSNHFAFMDRPDAFWEAIQRLFT